MICFVRIELFRLVEIVVHIGLQGHTRPGAGLGRSGVFSPELTNHR